MSRIVGGALMACMFCCAVACQSVSAQALSESARTARVTFDDKRAVKVVAVVGHPIVIELDANERIEDIVQSDPDTSDWEIAPRGSRLVLLASKGAKPKTLTVLTRARSFPLELVGVPATPENLAKRVARLSIDLPAAPKPPVPLPPPEPPAPLAATEPLSGPRVAQRRNLSYSLQVVSESVDIRPREVFDDGRFTYFRFPANVEVPSIYRTVPDAKEEWLVNFHREGEFVVMQAVSPLWTLRLGGSVLGVFNDAFNADGRPVNSGTTTHALKREMKK